MAVLSAPVTPAINSTGGATLRCSGRSSWKLRIKELCSWKYENSVLEPQEDIVELIAELYPFNGPRIQVFNLKKKYKEIR